MIAGLIDLIAPALMLLLLFGFIASCATEIVEDAREFRTHCASLEGIVMKHHHHEKVCYKDGIIVDSETNFQSKRK